MAKPIAISSQTNYDRFQKLIIKTYEVHLTSGSKRNHETMTFTYKFSPLGGRSSDDF